MAAFVGFGVCLVCFVIGGYCGSEFGCCIGLGCSQMAYRLWWLLVWWLLLLLRGFGLSVVDVAWFSCCVWFCLHPLS